MNTIPRVHNEHSEASVMQCINPDAMCIVYSTEKNFLPSYSLVDVGS